MFKAFKKKSKPLATPMFGGGGKSRSLFSLTRSTDKRRSGSSVALDLESPVQMLSLHYQHGSDLIVDAETSHNNNNNRHRFSTFLTDDVPGNSSARKQHHLLRERSKSADDLDIAGGIELCETKSSYLLDDDTSASSALDEIQNSSHNQPTLSSFSTFRNPEANVGNSILGSNRKNVNEDNLIIARNIPVPEGFADPDADIDCLSHLPSEFDAVSVRSSQYESPVIKPPQGFIDMLTEISGLNTSDAEYNRSNEDTDNIKMSSSDNQCSKETMTESRRGKKMSTNQSNSSSQEYSNTSKMNSIITSCGEGVHPTLPPKSNILTINKYKPGYKSYGTNPDCVENGSRMETSQVENGDFMKREGANANMDTSKIELAGKDSLLVNSKPMPPPRRNRACTDGKSVPKEEQQIVSEDAGMETSSSQDRTMSDNNEMDDSKRDDENGMISDQHSGSDSSRMDNSKAATGKSPQLMQVPMVSSLREHLKRSPYKPVSDAKAPTFENKADELLVAKCDNDGSEEIKSTREESPSVRKFVTRSLNRENSCSDLNIMDNTNTTRNDPVMASPNQPYVQVEDVLTKSASSESPHIFISNQFLDDTIMASHESNCVCDSEVSPVSDMAKNRENHLVSSDNTYLHYKINDTISTIISTSFLNDTETPMLNMSHCSNSTQLNDTVIIEDDYVPESLTPMLKRGPLKDSPPDQPWEISMAMSWHLSKQKLTEIGTKQHLDTYPNSIGSMDSESTLEHEGHKDVTDNVYRWQLKPTSLWNTDDICQWLESKDLEIFKPVVEEKQLTGPDLIEDFLTKMGELVGNEVQQNKLLHEVKNLQQLEAKNQQSGTKKVLLLNEETQEGLPSVASSSDYQPSSLGSYAQPENSVAVFTVPLSDERYKKLPVMKWTTQDVVTWLESVGMDKFSATFKAQNITGQDLASIDMELLDSLGISSIQDREFILSRLYELQHPESGSCQVARIKEIFQQVPSFESDRESDRSSNNSRMLSLADEEIAVKNNFPVRNLKIWHDVKGYPMDTTIMVTSQMSSYEVKVKVLYENEVMDNATLFTLTRVTMDTNTGEVCTYNLADGDKPYVVHQSIKTKPELKARLELRSSKTRTVKVLFCVDEDITFTKMFDVSTMCTFGELLSMAASVYMLADVSRYCLQAVGDDEVPQIVGTTKLLLMYKCDTYKLVGKQGALENTRRSSADEVEGISNRKSKIWQKDQNFDTKCSKKSYQEDLSELREGLLEKDKIICQLQLENEAFQADIRQARDLRSLFSVMEREMKQGQTDLLNKYKVLEQQLGTVRSESCGISGHEDQVDILQDILIVTSQQIQLVEQRERILQAQLVTAQANVKPDPLVIQHLKYQLSDTDFCLLDLKQQQADVYRQLKMARRQLAKMYKTSVDPDRFSIFKLVQELGYSPSILHQVITFNLDVSSNKCDFILGHDSHNRPFVKHADENSLLQKGDRIVEINGASVTHLNESELSKHLQLAAGSLSLVVLRKTMNCELKVQEKIEEAESIREDLSLAMIELESIQEENKDIKSELERVSIERIQLQEKSSDLETQVMELKSEIEQQRHEVQAQIKQFQEQLQKKDEEIEDLKNQISSGAGSLRVALQGLSRKSSVLSRLSDGGIKPTINGGPAESAQDSHNGDTVLSYEEFGEVPIWQSLQMAPKSDILQALKDQVLENQQQKAYLDHLLTAVIDNAPNLVQVVDQCIGILDENALEMKARSEEFC